MNTKHTSATTAPKRIAEIPAPRKPIEITEFQKHVCELAGDIILHGGHENELADLLRAVIAHEWRRMFGDNYPKDPAQREKRIEEAIDRRLATWTQKLTRLWPETPEPKEAPLPACVTDEARANARGSLAWDFEDFLGRATPEDVALLRQVMVGWRSNGSYSPEPEWGVCSLAEAFAEEIGRRETYIRVPEQHKSLVEKYLEMLFEASGEDVG